jgi:hypothetical protein
MPSFVPSTVVMLSQWAYNPSDDAQGHDGITLVPTPVTFNEEQI